MAPTTLRMGTDAPSFKGSGTVSQGLLDQGQMTTGRSAGRAPRHDCAMTSFALTPDGTQLAFDDTGGPGEPVLLVCGQGQDRHFWRGFAQALTDTAPGRWRPIALDPR